MARYEVTWSERAEVLALAAKHGDEDGHAEYALQCEYVEAFTSKREAQRFANQLKRAGRDWYERPTVEPVSD